MQLTVFTDGGSLNNPGPAASAFAVFQPDDKLLYRDYLRIGNQSNNFAEYTAVVKALEWLLTNKPAGLTNIEFYSDSNLMVNQLNGLFKIKNSTIREFVLKIRSLEQELGLPIIYNYIPREKNRYADSLVKKALSNL